MTCQGQPVLLHCRTDRGSNVKYSWSREGQSQNIPLQSSADLLFHCAILTEDARYICSALNSVSREQSKPISLHLQQTGQENCIYSLMSDGQLQYKLLYKHNFVFRNNFLVIFRKICHYILPFQSLKVTTAGQQQHHQ